MKYEIYSSLPPEAEQIRKDVFINEQGFENEFDNRENSSKHIVLFNNDGEAIATARYYPDGKDNYRIGRIAVIKSMRGKGVGRLLLETIEKELCASDTKTITVIAQVRAKGFYQSLGYINKYYYTMDEGVPHVTMIKTIK